MNVVTWQKHVPLDAVFGLRISFHLLTDTKSRRIASVKRLFSSVVPGVFDLFLLCYRTYLSKLINGNSCFFANFF